MNFAKYVYGYFTNIFYAIFRTEYFFRILIFSYDVLVYMPPRKAEINKNSRYAPYPVWKITELIKLIDPAIKGLSTMNKGYIINVLSKLIEDEKS